jgi:hypothetical protein
MNTFAKAAIALGSLCVLVSLLLLPWITFLDPQTADQRLAELLADPRVQSVIDKMPAQMRAQVGLQWPPSSADIRTAFRAPELQGLIDATRQQRWLSGWTLWRSDLQASRLLRLSLLSAGVVAILAVIWLAVSGISSAGRAVRISAMAIAVGSGITLLLLLWQVPSVDTFGLRDNLGVLLICTLAGSRAGPGIWVALVGLVLLTAGFSIASVLVKDEEAIGETDLPG